MILEIETKNRNVKGYEENCDEISKVTKKIVFASIQKNDICVVLRVIRGIHEDVAGEDVTRIVKGIINHDYVILG